MNDKKITLTKRCMSRSERTRMILATMDDLRNDNVTYVYISEEEARRIINGRCDRNDVINERMEF